MRRTFQVFIYGSLLPDQHNHHVVERFVIRSEKGKVAGRLVDYGPYPALIRDLKASNENTFVIGQWITVDEAGLAAMDELEQFYGYEESNDYERVWVTDLVHDHLEGWVYIWDSDRGFPAIGQSYWPDFYAAKTTR
ncbi:gamma-glutamylcyclotransferase family protein [Paenibacillus kobensis]|uniref:gamma-glutamylcyclotransferase family protein n=1 Tax=Paenibacillus kobensis TaxID=59841 RepID=UPI000FDC6D7E|nr:gamma-glutamylcyclotransferase family protein [Paenibacillus kobensis]